jgi:hypothetical protein
VLAERKGCLFDTLTMVTYLSVGDPFIREPILDTTTNDEATDYDIKNHRKEDRLRAYRIHQVRRNT